MTEVTSAEVAAIAGRLIKHKDPDVRTVAASALTQFERETQAVVDAINQAGSTLLARTAPDQVGAALDVMKAYQESGRGAGLDGQVAHLFMWLRGEVE